MTEPTDADDPRRWPDSPYPVTPGQAAGLAIHHLALAALYFEPSPEDDDNAAAISMAKHVFADNPAGLAAALVWLRTMYLEYENMK